MDTPEFARLLDGALTNPLLRGLDIAYVRRLPAGDEWWSPGTHRTVEVYLYPGPFGSERLKYLDERATQCVERTAALLLDANEGRLLPAAPIPLRLGEWLIETGYLVLAVGPLSQASSPPATFALWSLPGAAVLLLGRGLHAWMWHQVSRPTGASSAARGLAADPR
ncbi:MAG: hypothetical protein M3281_07760 [Chloroflexota bacterium]|nr:hypothetical protein [Chloroflexota bacterium]